MVKCLGQIYFCIHIEFKATLKSSNFNETRYYSMECRLFSSAKFLYAISINFGRLFDVLLLFSVANRNHIHRNINWVESRKHCTNDIQDVFISIGKGCYEVQRTVKQEHACLKGPVFIHFIVLSSFAAPTQYPKSPSYKHDFFFDG